MHGTMYGGKTVPFVNSRLKPIANLCCDITQATYKSIEDDVSKHSAHHADASVDCVGVSWLMTHGSHTQASRQTAGEVWQVAASKQDPAKRQNLPLHKGPSTSADDPSPACAARIWHVQHTLLLLGAVGRLCSHLGLGYNLLLDCRQEYWGRMEGRTL